MKIIAENINASVGFVREIIEKRDETKLVSLVDKLIAAEADYIDICSGRSVDTEFDDLMFVLEVLKGNDLPVFLDSPYEDVLIKIIDSGVLNPGDVINSASLQRNKCGKIFDALKGSDLGVVILSNDDEGIPANREKRLEIANKLLKMAGDAKISFNDIYVDFCLESVCLKPESLNDYIYCMGKIKNDFPNVNTIAALSNISFGMPKRSAVNGGAVSILSYYGLDSAIINPLDRQVMSMVYSSDVLSGKDKNGRNYNKNYRLDRF